jgi:hypothetical protein
VPTPRFICIFTVYATLIGCSVDARQLRPASDGEAGSSSSLGGSSNQATTGASAKNSKIYGSSGAGANSDSEGGAGGDVVQPPTIATVDGCADLNGDGVADCQQTLVANATFDSNVASWHADTGASLTWDPRDSLNAGTSGTALLSAASGAFDAGGSSLVTASQCITVTGGQIVITYANVFIDKGQDSSGQAAIDVDLFGAPGCAGTATSSFSTPMPENASPGVWLAEQAGLKSPNGTRSALVRLAIDKPFQADSYHARFDNILVYMRSDPSAQ